MTLEALQYLVTDLALKRNLVDCAMSGPSIYAINPEDIKEYPLVFVSPTGTHTIKENTTRYSLTFFYMDRLFEDSSNEEAINSAGIETLRNLKLQLSKLEVVTDIEEDVDIRLFTETERMADRVAGAYMTVWIETLNPSTCPAFFDEYGYYMGNYFATEGLEAVLDSLASKEWVKRYVAEHGGGVSGVTEEEVEELISHALRYYTKTNKFAKINGSGITNNEQYNLLETEAFNEFLSAYTIEIQNIWNSMASGGTPSDYNQVKAQVTANTDNIAILSAQTSANTAQIAELSAATETALSGINETVIALSAQTSGISQDLGDLSGYTEQAVSSLTHDIETLSAAISAATPADYDAVKAQVSANTQNITALSGTTSGIASDLSALSAYTATLTGGSKDFVLDAAAIYSASSNEVRTALWELADQKYLAGYRIYLKGRSSTSSSGYDIILPLTKYRPYTEGDNSSGQLDFTGKDGNLNLFWDINFYHRGTIPTRLGSGGVLSTSNIYSLPTASASGKGGIRVGTGLSMSGEVMSADISSSDVHSIVALTQAAYDQLATRESTTLYIIKPTTI